MPGNGPVAQLPHPSNAGNLLAKAQQTPLDNHGRLCLPACRMRSRGTVHIARSSITRSCFGREVPKEQ